MFTYVNKAVKFQANQKKVQQLNSDQIKHQEGKRHNTRYSLPITTAANSSTEAVKEVKYGKSVEKLAHHTGSVVGM